jgi:DNA-binding LacI/PurR family transcriptional regulator
MKIIVVPLPQRDYNIESAYCQRYHHLLLLLIISNNFNIMTNCCQFQHIETVQYLWIYIGGEHFLRYTIYDIAKLANVSKSTVSRVLNNQTNISAEAKERVLNAIAELKYQPNKVARGLSSGFDAIMVLSRSSKTTANNPFFSEIIQTISAKAEEENFDLILHTSQNSNDEIEKCINKIKEKMIKGILMLTSPADEVFYQELDVFDIPIVVIGRVDGTYKNVYSVDTNNYQDSYDLTDYLYQKGHRDIACLHSPLEYHVSIDRLKGYKDCMVQHGLPLNEGWIINSGYTVDSAYEAAKSLLLSKKRPTAVVANDDLKVWSLYKAAAELKISIPENISVVGYSNSPFLSPSLTRVEIPIDELGAVGSDILFSKISGMETESRTVVPTRKIIQDSVFRLN